MINFPDSPAVNQVFASGLFTYKWDGTVWMDQGANYGDAPADGKMYGRFNTAWARAVALGGDTMTGLLTTPAPLTIDPGTTPASAYLKINKRGAGMYAYINASKDGLSRWQILMGDYIAEAGSNAGSNFAIERFDDNGNYLGQAITINRATGLVGMGNFTAGQGSLSSSLALRDSMNLGSAGGTNFTMNKGGSGQVCDMWTHTNGVPRWLFRLSNEEAESGGNAGSNVAIHRYGDAGDYLGSPLTINRSNGQFYFSLNINFPSASVSGAITAAGINTTATGYNYATHIRGGAGSGSAGLFNFNWYDDGTAPGYLWGSSDAVNMRVYPPSRLTCGNSAAVSGISGWNYSNRTKNPVYIWCTDGSGADQYLTQPGYLSVSYANSAGSAPANGGTATNSNQLGGLGPGSWLQNSSSALISIRNNGAAQLLANISGSGDSWWPVNPPSDANLKKNIAPSRIDALADVMQIEFVEFQYRDDIPWHAGENDPPDHPAFFQIDDGRLHRIGVTTQQLRTIHPDLVNSELGTHSTPDKDELLWRALRSIQQLGAKVEALTVRIAELEKERP